MKVNSNYKLVIIIKRLFDVLVSIFLLILLLPIILFLFISVKLKIGSPIIFKQERPGLNGNPFFLYKFRTMTDSFDLNGRLLPDSERLTHYGRWLRKYSLDEIPQLINVIKGDISLVGPRPLLMEYLQLYTDEQKKRHDVRPGITGWAQVNGRNNLSWEEKFELDLWYVKNHSILIDLKILLMTVVKVIKSEGIQNGDHVTMPIFRGEKKYERKV